MAVLFVVWHLRLQTGERTQSRKPLILQRTYTYCYDDNVRTRERDLASFAVNMGLRNRPIKLKGGWTVLCQTFQAAKVHRWDIRILSNIVTCTYVYLEIE